VEFLYAFIALIVGIALGFAINKFLVQNRTASSREAAERIVQDAEKQAETLRKEAVIEAKDQVFRLKQEAETEAKERRKELTALQDRLASARSRSTAGPRGSTSVSTSSRACRDRSPSARRTSRT
jgi:ribonucrease Y